jgi:hypothetical protein
MIVRPGSLFFRLDVVAPVDDQQEAAQVDRALAGELRRQRLDVPGPQLGGTGRAEQHAAGLQRRHVESPRCVITGRGRGNRHTTRPGAT